MESPSTLPVAISCSLVSKPQWQAGCMRKQSQISLSIHTITSATCFLHVMYFSFPFSVPARLRGLQVPGCGRQGTPGMPSESIVDILFQGIFFLSLGNLLFLSLTPHETVSLADCSVSSWPGPPCPIQSYPPCIMQPPQFISVDCESLILVSTVDCTLYLSPFITSFSLLL